MHETIRPPILPKSEILIESDERRYNLRPRKRINELPKYEGHEKKTCFSHTGMNFHEEFLYLKDEGCITNRWIMVNIYSRQDYLNRIFRESIRVQSIVHNHFVLQKMRKHSHRATEYSKFYRPDQYPYLAIIDPFTGVKLESWNESESEVLLCLIENFLQKHGLPDGRRFPLNAFIGTEGGSSNESQHGLDSRSQEKGGSSNESQHGLDSRSQEEGGSSNESQHEFDPRSQEEASDYENMYVDSDEEVEVGENADNSVIMIRMPNGDKKQIVWPSSTALQYLVSFVYKLGFDRLQYSLVKDYPRQNLFDLDMHLTLKEAKLHPSVVIYIQCKE